MSVDTKAFRYISYGLYVVTSRDGERLNGQIANAVIQVTSKPSKLAVVLNKENLTNEFVTKSRVFAISVLEEETPMLFIGLFGFKSGRDVDKLSQVSYQVGETGAPLVTDHAVAVMEAKVVKTMDVGSHTVFVGEVVGARVIKGGNPMTYAYYHQVKGGKSPKRAPTYIDERSVQRNQKKKGETR
jgi:flavin reductase (DIM6/NTAB) family NADH-FMN oxidoreductase RutF